LGLISHDETVSRLGRRLAVGDKPKLLGILHIASVTSGTSIEGDRIRSAQHPILAVCWTSGLVFSAADGVGSLPSKDAAAAFLESAVRHHLLLRSR